jgi:inward rectifier potassium channel
MNDRNPLEEENINEEIVDLGLASKDIVKGQRLMNKDGSFNGRRTGLPFWESFNFYHYLVGVSWFKFMFLVITGYVALNLIFALVYYLIGVDGHLIGVIAHNEAEKFQEAFFFSFQSFTTVGYGRISPIGSLASSIAAFESLIGLLMLAIATGLFYGRFSRPISKILYSKNAIIAPFKDINGFQFRIANEQHSELIDVEIRVTMSKLVFEGGAPVRKFFNLELEYTKINFFPLAWTINHPIDKDSPMYGMTKEDVERSQAEWFILLQGFDDMFSTIVNSRSSYRYNEIVVGAKFDNLYGKDSSGRVTVELDKIDDYHDMELNKY